MKVIFFILNIVKGVEIIKWKELLFFFFLEFKRFLVKEFSLFILQFLGNRVDYGEVLYIIFYLNIFKFIFGGMFKIIENLLVCLGINDLVFVDIVERKNKSQLYFVDFIGIVVDG